LHNTCSTSFAKISRLNREAILLDDIGLQGDGEDKLNGFVTVREIFWVSQEAHQRRK